VLDVREDDRFAGLYGSGVTTVVIDTGIDLNHPFFGPDMDGNGIADRILFQYDFANNDADASSVSAHGPHVASLIGSQDSLYPGVAPETDLIALKVFEDSGRGYFSYLEQALQWVIANEEAYHIGVVNLSLGDGGNWTDAFSRYGIGDELAALAGTDVIVVGAAGNNYYQFGRLGVAYPASDPAVLAVGATWAGDFGGPWKVDTGATDYTTGTDRIAAFSQRDPDLLDAFAPGARFNGANATDGIRTMMGTSQAAAVVSGVAALSQQLAMQGLGRFLTTGEFALLLEETNVTIVDGDDENDNVPNSGLEYGRIDFEALAEHILTLDEVPADDGGTPGGGASDGQLHAASGVHQVGLTAGQTATGFDFGNFQLGEIGGGKFEDIDGNGVREEGEHGLAGWTIYLDSNENGMLDAGEQSTVTDEAGDYAFTDLGPGTYRVAEVLQAGWVQTVPAEGSYHVTMASGLLATSLDFGNQPINDAPLNAVPGPQTLDEDTVLVFSGATGNAINISDPDAGSNPVQVRLTASNGILTLGGTVGLVFSIGDGTADGTMAFSGTLADINAGLEGLMFEPSVNFNGDASLDLATNDLGNTGAGGPQSDIDTVDITVTAVNDAPVLAKIPSVFGWEEGTVYSFAAEANDVDLPADVLTFGLDEGAAHGATIDPVTGVFSWTPTEAQGPGTYHFVARVTDSAGLFSTAAFGINVAEINQPPSLAALGPQSVNEGELLTIGLNATDPDLPANQLTYTATDLPDGAIFDPDTSLFTWTPTEAQGPGTYTVIFAVSDGEFSDERAITITVNEVNDAPVLDPIGNKAIDEETALTFTVTATDPDFPANGLIFSLDGGAPEGATIDPMTGLFTWTPSDGLATACVTVRVTDDGNPALSGWETFCILVQNVAPNLTYLAATPTTENGVTTLTGEILDPGRLDTFTLDVNWGDPLSPLNIETYVFGAGTKDFTLSHQYLNDNPAGTPSDDYTISLAITDDDGGTSAGSVTVTVSNVAPEITALLSSALEVGDARPGDVIEVSGLFADIGTLDEHTAVIDWGDGSATPAVIDHAAGSFSGTHAYMTGGIFDIKVILSDDDLGSAEGWTTALVTGARIKDGELQVVGTHGNDWVEINEACRKLYKVHADFLPGRCHYLTFNAADVESIRVLLGDGNDHATVAGNIELPLTIDGGAGDDHLNGGRGPVVLIGGAGNDKLFGSSSSDEIYGDDGNDVIFGRGGADLLDAGAGNDIVHGSWGNETILGGDGNDVLFGDGGNDAINAGAGDDLVFGGRGDDKIWGGDGNDLLAGGPGKDTLDGGPGHDTLIDWSRDWDCHGPENALGHHARVTPCASWVPDFAVKNGIHTPNDGIQVVLSHANDTRPRTDSDRARLKSALNKLRA
jgi:hypothetical protein